MGGGMFRAFYCDAWGIFGKIAVRGRGQGLACLGLGRALTLADRPANVFLWYRRRTGEACAAGSRSPEEFYVRWPRYLLLERVKGTLLSKLSPTSNRVWIFNRVCRLVYARVYCVARSVVSKDF